MEKISNALKFKRGTITKNNVIGQAHILGLNNEPSFIGANCCFINNGWISFGEIDSPAWNSETYIEITEQDFMDMLSLPQNK